MIYGKCLKIEMLKIMFMRFIIVVEVENFFSFCCGKLREFFYKVLIIFWILYIIKILVNNLVFIRIKLRDI